MELSKLSFGVHLCLVLSSTGLQRTFDQLSIDGEYLTRKNHERATIRFAIQSDDSICDTKHEAFTDIADLRFTRSPREFALLTACSLRINKGTLSEARMPRKCLGEDAALRAGVAVRVRNDAARVKAFPKTSRYIILFRRHQDPRYGLESLNADVPMQND